MSDWSARHFHPHQYVKVTLPPNKTEIGIVVSADEDKVVVSTRHGYNITAKPKQLQRAFLLVLDLNGVLGARQRKTLFERRPHLERFLKFALANFVVAVWTSCEERNGRQIVDDLFSDDRDRLLFCLYRGDCTPNPTAERPFGTIKNLQSIFDRWPESFHAVNTVIIDDSADKCSHPDIALCPSQFSGLVEQPDDDGLLSMITVLERVLEEDSLHPLIEAAAEHRRAWEAEAQRNQAAQESSPAMTSTVRYHSALSALPDASAIPVSAATMKSLQDKKVLCCHYVSDGSCKFGDGCRHAHEDDGVAACNRGTKCRHHGQRAGNVLPQSSELSKLQIGHPTMPLPAGEDSGPSTSSLGAHPPLGTPTTAGFNNLASTLLAKLNAAAIDDHVHHTDIHVGGDALSRIGSSYADDAHVIRRASSVISQEKDSPVKRPQPHQNRNFHQHQHHQREKHHTPGNGNTGGGSRNVVSILQNAQRVHAN
jgi:hypothetical protein